MQKSLALDPIRKAQIARYNAKSVTISKEAQRINREKRQLLRQEEIAHYSLAQCHHKYA
jgi:hypothetical protein